MAQLTAVVLLAVGCGQGRQDTPRRAATTVQTTTHAADRDPEVTPPPKAVVGRDGHRGALRFVSPPVVVVWVPPGTAPAHDFNFDYEVYVHLNRRLRYSRKDYVAIKVDGVSPAGSSTNAEAGWDTRSENERCAAAELAPFPGQRTKLQHPSAGELVAVRASMPRQHTYVQVHVPIQLGRPDDNAGLATDFWFTHAGCRQG